MEKLTKIKIGMAIFYAVVFIVSYNVSHDEYDRSSYKTIAAETTVWHDIHAWTDRANSIWGNFAD